MERDPHRLYLSRPDVFSSPEEAARWLRECFHCDEYELALYAALKRGARA